MLYPCPDCFGHGVYPNQVAMFGDGHEDVICRTCHGRRFVTSKRPGRHSRSLKKPMRGRTPAYILERREADRKARQEKKEMKSYLGSELWKSKHKWEGKYEDRQQHPAG
jgi:hypothetical protein